MLGIVGPDDTVTLIEQVAEEEGLRPAIMTARYQSADETVDIVRRLSQVCPVILFSGRLPYEIAISAGLDPGGLNYIPHEGTDLFRTLAIIALSSTETHHVPKLSFDCITASDVREAYTELGLDDFRSVIPLEVGRETSREVVGQITLAHSAFFLAGTVEQCATCIRAVYESLRGANVPVIRISHSKASVRQALHHAKLQHDLNRAEASQVAVVVLRPSPASRKRSQLSSVADLLAEKLATELLRSGDGEAILITSRDAAESRLEIRKDDGVPVWPDFVVGIGVGMNADQAKVYAHEAVEKARVSGSRYLLLGQTVLVVETIDPVNAREARIYDLELAQNLNVSPAIIRRLATVFKQLDPNAFTAAELAQSYNFVPRSARRLLYSLMERGFVEECGLRNRSGAGRPEVVYRIFLSRIFTT